MMNHGHLPVSGGGLGKADVTTRRGRQQVSIQCSEQVKPGPHVVPTGFRKEGSTPS